jgi:hypothetical protein
MVGCAAPAPSGDRNVTVNVPAVRKPPVLGREELLGALLQTVELLQRRRAGEIGPGYIDGYVALNWLEWNGGTLRLTVTGDNMRKQQAAARQG